MVVGAGMADNRTDDLCRLATRPFAFIARYLRQRPLSHIAIVTAVLAAVGCSVTAQYGIKTLIDALASPAHGSTSVWIAFVLLVSLIAADNLFWRLASWIANGVFVKVTGDLRSDLFRHLTGHAPSYFQDRLPPRHR
jgi:ATP-binding cassette, subfamily B, bacterial